jgi:hypothetical protein
MNMPSQRTRAYIYRVLSLVLVVLAGKGVISGDDVLSYGGLIAAVLGVGLAAANTPTS